jgi:exodeoxyribonuclease V alpha subunit
MTIWNHQYDARQDLGFREGDFVICTKNFWEKGLQNGSIGQIKHIGEIDQDDVSGEIAWDDGEVRSFDQDLIGHLELAYALTIHKAQGSQWRRVVVCLKGSAVLDRSLIYTALTRATKQVIIVGGRRDLEAAIKAPKAADRRRMVALGRWMAAIRAESPLQSRSTTRAASAE